MKPPGGTRFRRITGQHRWNVSVAVSLLIGSLVGVQQETTLDCPETVLLVLKETLPELTVWPVFPPLNVKPPAGPAGCNSEKSQVTAKRVIEAIVKGLTLLLLLSLRNLAGGK